MKKYLFLIIVSFLFFLGCGEPNGSYSFIIKNSTSETIKIKFLNNNNSIDMEEVILLSSEEKFVRLIDIGIGVYPSDFIKTHFYEDFSELIFDTYIDGNKLDKDLWLPENWTYSKKSEWEAEYKMTITNEMLD